MPQISGPTTNQGMTQQGMASDAGKPGGAGQGKAGGPAGIGAKGGGGRPMGPPPMMAPHPGINQIGMGSSTVDNPMIGRYNAPQQAVPRPPAPPGMVQPGITTNQGLNPTFDPRTLR